ncbi:MAG: PilX N-terminal domain-containing pilus assembly protein [Thiotrichaceae bacterium]|nr:PilX N-terminal domain-containing pilus assembly protein [Thiotrichaceae bacterium]
MRYGDSKEKGVVLIWSIVILLVLTLLGISAVKMSKTGTQIAGNTLFSMLVFQGAESAIGQANQMVNLNTAEEVAEDANPGNNVVTLANVVTDHKNGLRADVEIQKTAAQPLPCPASNFGFASNMSCNYYEIEASSTLRGKGASTNHVLGVAKVGPKIDATYTQ